MQILKIALTIWIIFSSAGLTYSFLTERDRRLMCMKDMTEGLRRLGFYISHWQLPLEEAFEAMQKEKTGTLTDFYKKIAEGIKSRRTSDLGDLWREESLVFFHPYGIPLAVLEIWSGSFADMAPLPAEEHRRLDLKAEQIEKICTETEEKYRQERRPFMATGLCAGAIFCLLIW